MLVGFTRRRAAPGAALLVLLGLGACGDGAGNAEGTVAAAPRSAVPVVVEPVRRERSQTRVEAVGTARARRSVSLYPEASGEVVAINFRAGERVQAGVVLLALDARDQRLALELAELRLAEAKRMLERYRSANDRLDLAVPEATVDTARTEVERARIEREQAALALDRRFVRAPFDGVVGITDVDAGDRIDPATAITTLDDRSALLVSFPVPEALVGRLAVGDALRVETWDDSARGAGGTVVAIDSRVDPASRAFTARAEVPNGADRLRPGMSFRVRVEVPGAVYPTVPEVALEWGSTGAQVWVVEDGRARRVDAAIVQRREGRILIDAELPAGSAVVSEGVQSLRDGVAVRPLDAAALARDARRSLNSGANEG